jgi:hypothetical protein
LCLQDSQSSLSISFTILALSFFAKKTKKGKSIFSSS